MLTIFSYNLKCYRKCAGYSQKDMSQKLHISRQAYANYEHAAREPGLSTLAEISHILQVTIDFLLFYPKELLLRSRMEIERKFLLKEIPKNLSEYKSLNIEQGYLCTAPVVRIRKQDDTYILTYKSKGMMIREEYNLPLTKTAYEQLRPKVDGILISKTRYLIPLDETHTIELDVFEEDYDGLYLAEVEFASKEEAEAFVPPHWFGEEVTFAPQYHNSFMSKKKTINSI